MGSGAGHPFASLFQTYKKRLDELFKTLRERDRERDRQRERKVDGTVGGLRCLTVSLKQFCFNSSYDFPVRDVLFVSCFYHRRVIGKTTGKLL